MQERSENRRPTGRGPDRPRTTGRARPRRGALLSQALRATVRRVVSEREGSMLLLALLVLATLSVLATTAVVTSMGDRNLSRYDRESVQALGAAETGVAFAKRAIVDQTAQMEDSDGDGHPDFTLSDSLSWGGSYNVLAEASDIKGLGITAYQSNGFTIVSEGSYHGIRRRVKMAIVHDSFLKFARFVSANDLSYACDALVSGEAYAGHNLVIPCNCASGHEDQFLESVYAVNDIPNPTCATFFRGYVTHADTIDISNSFNWTDIRNKARGLGADNSCERHGNIGIYIRLTTTDPLHLHSQAAPNQDVLLLDKFDFSNTTLAPPDTLITYNNVAVPNPNTGGSLRRSQFNGIIFFDSSGKLKGTCDGVSGRNLTFYFNGTCTVMWDIICGHTGFNPVTRLPNNSGDPVNIALVAESYIAMEAGTPKTLRVDAALFSRTSNWRGLGDLYSHPNGVNPGDLDLDGITGETPVNNDPTQGDGWDEAHVGNSTWVLNITGPIITVTTGDAQPWNAVVGDGPTRRYNYDLDMTDYPPPCFPIPLNLWKDVSWTEIFDLSGPLADNLPH